MVPDTDEDVDEDTVQSWTMEGEEVEESEVITVDKVIFLQRQILQNALFILIIHLKYIAHCSFR